MGEAKRKMEAAMTGEIVVPTTTLKIVKYPWPETQPASADGKCPLVPTGHPTYAIQEQRNMKYYYWAYVVPEFAVEVLHRLGQTTTAEHLSDGTTWQDRPVKANGRFRL